MTVAACRMQGAVCPPKGAKLGDLPIDVIKQHVLIINLKSTREIGVTIPSELLRRADQVIE